MNTSKFLLFITLSFSSELIIAQKEDSLLFMAGIESYQAKNYHQAIEKWKAVLDIKNDSSFYFGRSFNNIPIAYASMDSIVQAEIWFNKIFHSNLNDLDEGTNIMEPYANYRHNAAMVCSKMFAQSRNYQKALQYIWLADTLYQYRTISGTSFEKRCVSITLWKADFYQELNNLDSVIFVLSYKVMDREISHRLPSMASFTPLDFYEPLRERLEEILSSETQQQDFKKSLDKGLKSSKLINQTGKKFIVFSIKGNQYKIRTNLSKRKFIKKIRASEFYKLF